MREPIQWDDYFMLICYAASRRSKDPNTQVGCLIATLNNRLVSTGFNGPWEDVNDMKICWDRPNKYDYIIHAEENAILFAVQNKANQRLEDCKMYVTGKPCSRCIRLIGRVGIKKIIYDITPIYSVNDNEWEKTKLLAWTSGILMEKYIASNINISNCIDAIKNS